MTIQFQNYPAVNNDSDDKTLYGDIITHCKDWQHFADKNSKYTTAHECTHGINNDIRNASGDWEGKNGFYVGSGRSILLDEPKFKKSAIVAFIPQELRSARFSLYVTGQQPWDDKPLYIYDEGVAYINGAWSAIQLKEQDNYVEDFRVTALAQYYKRPIAIERLVRHYPSPFPVVNHGDKLGNTIVDGHIEFIAYMTAVLMCADQHGGLAQNLADFSRWLFRHAANAYHRQLKDGFPAFDVQDQLWQTMKTGSVYEQHRQFLKSRIGFEFPDAEISEDDDNPIPWTI